MVSRYFNSGPVEYYVWCYSLLAAPIEEEAAVPDEHYLRVTKKMPIKVHENSVGLSVSCNMYLHISYTCIRLVLCRVCSGASLSSREL